MEAVGGGDAEGVGGGWERLMLWTHVSWLLHPNFASRYPSDSFVSGFVFIGAVALLSAESYIFVLSNAKLSDGSRRPSRCFPNPCVASLVKTFEGDQMQPSDYAHEDIGNLVLLEHINLTIPDQSLATAFYVSGLGLTRDPYLMTGLNNMWINIGRSQIHLPHGDAQRLRGHVALIVGKRESLVARLRAVRPVLDRTAFGWTERADRVEITCPWGNRYDCLDPNPDQSNAPWSRIDLGIAYVQLDVPLGCAGSIAAFYREVFNASVEVRDHNGSQQTAIAVGTHQQLIYSETPAANLEYDGHHIQIYVANFSEPYARLAARGLVYDEEPHQYRFADVIDPVSGAHCFKLEHEVRSLRHPLYARPLVNRNPDQSNRNYRMGGDARRGVF
ncbi:VOC family protein [Paraburkholderia aspalathi]|uniref:VOC family protein n=1 Tax=Paraburkholderia aspalathi TaxID=1324617 RepID=UPI001FD10D66|nr:VOC family protein [Paraburkholderia aspalathi]